MTDDELAAWVAEQRAANNAIKQARIRNRRNRERWPLLAAIGALAHYSPEDHLAKKAACLTALREATAASHLRNYAAVELYLELCGEFVDEATLRAWTLAWNTSRRPKTPEYLADYWYQRTKQAICRSDRCPCGGIWLVGALHRRVGQPEPTSYLDWYCNTCGRPPAHLQETP